MTRQCVGLLSAAVEHNHPLAHSGGPTTSSHDTVLHVIESSVAEGISSMHPQLTPLLPLKATADNTCKAAGVEQQTAHVRLLLPPFLCSEPQLFSCSRCM